MTATAGAPSVPSSLPNARPIAIRAPTSAKKFGVTKILLTVMALPLRPKTRGRPAFAPATVAHGPAASRSARRWRAETPGDSCDCFGSNSKACSTRLLSANGGWLTKGWSIPNTLVATDMPTPSEIASSAVASGRRLNDLIALPSSLLTTTTADERPIRSSDKRFELRSRSVLLECASVPIQYLFPGRTSSHRELVRLRGFVHLCWYEMWRSS